MGENWKRILRVSWYLIGPLFLYAWINDVVTIGWCWMGRFDVSLFRLVPESVAAAAAGALILGIWFCRERVAYPGKQQHLYRWIILVPVAAVSCIFLNHLLVFIGIPSEGYDKVKDMIFRRDLIWQIAGAGCLVPLAEELVFRGLGYGRLRREMKALPAAVITAVLFGLYHGNLIQGMYAFFMGLLLALVCEAYGNLASSWLFHAAANMTAILLTDTPAQAWLSSHTVIMLTVTTLGGMMLFGFIVKLREDIN